VGHGTEGSTTQLAGTPSRTGREAEEGCKVDSKLFITEKRWSLFY
jgi:hypothetical protein